MRLAAPLMAVALVACGGGTPKVSSHLAPQPATPSPNTHDLGPLSLVAFSPSAPSAPPISLTSAGGVALALVSLDARTVVEDPLSYTELSVVFDNPEDRTIEGRLKVALPPGAAIGRLAMRIDDRWQEGEVVDLGKARDAYEDSLHQGWDPALLEQGPGNEVTARVHPIRPKARTRIVIGYSQPLAGNGPVLQTRGLDKLEHLHVAVTRPAGAGKAKTLLEIDKQGFVPAHDYVLDSSVTAAPVTAVRHGQAVVARVTVVGDTSPALLDDVLVLVDTSASRGLGLNAELSALRDIAARVANQGGKLEVACFDQELVSVFRGAAKGFGKAELDRIATRRALGASNLELALDWARHSSRARRVVLLTDGVATAGAADAEALSGKVAQLGDRGVKRLDAVAVGGIRDDALLARLVTKLPDAGVVIDPGQGEALARLEKSTIARLPVSVAGASWSWPQELRGVQAGDRALVYAELQGEAVTIGLGEATHRALPSAGTGPLVARALARARIDSLLPRARTNAEARREVVALSTRHRVLSPYTGLLVLETDADFRRYGIAREALSDVLVVEQGRIVTRNPSHAAPPPAAAPAPSSQRPRIARLPSARPPRAAAATPPPNDARGNMWGDAIGESFGAGGLGLTGIGEGGGGRGEGVGHGVVGSLPSRRPGPSLRAADTTVSGRLDPSVVQRPVRAKFGLLRSAYQQALSRDPNIRGRVVVRFVIDRGGKVQRASVTSADIRDATLLQKIREVFLSLRFPSPGGTVTVAYPIVFNDSTSAPASPPPARAPAKAPKPATQPYQGQFAEVMALIAAGKHGDALGLATKWHAKEPGSNLALIALGEALEAKGHQALARRAYGSLIDLFPSQVEVRRYAAARLERVGDEQALALALDSYARARDMRPDHPSGHRQLAYAQLAAKQPAAAFDTLAKALAQQDRRGRFSTAERILHEDLAIVAAAWRAASPAQANDILRRLKAAGAEPDDKPSLRFVLSWETDANDVDLHVHDEKGGHAYYSSPKLPSGGELYGDVTNGFGPECFALGHKQGAYRLQAHYYRRGVMGFGMGKLQIVEHDGKGGVKLVERPFLVMRDDAYVELGSYP